MRSAWSFKPRGGHSAPTGRSLFSGLLFGPARLRNRFGFLSSLSGFSFRWQIGSLLGLDRRNKPGESPTFSTRKAHATEARSHVTGRWGLAMTKSELDSTLELDASAQDIQAQTSQIEAEFLNFSPSLEGADISETARQAFARFDDLMQRWQLKAEDLNKKMMSPALRDQFAQALPSRKVPSAFFTAHRHPHLAPSLPRPSFLSSREKKALSHQPSQSQKTLARSMQTAQSAREALQSRLMAMHHHTDALSAGLHENSHRLQERLRRKAQLSPSLKPPLVKPEDEERR